MKFWARIRQILFALIAICFAFDAAAQTEPQNPLKVLRIDYGKAYQLQDSYSIIYDNPSQSAKLQDFRVTFYGPGRIKLTETKTETHPVNSKIETYQLTAPVTGFTEVELSVLSLHGGGIEDFPASIGEILALNELTEVPETSNQSIDEDVVAVNSNPAETETPPAPPPGLTAAERQRLSDVKTDVAQRLTELREDLSKFTSETYLRAGIQEEIDALIADVSALSSRTVKPDLKSEIAALGTEIENKATEADISDEGQALSAAEAQLSDIQRQLNDLVSLSNADGADPESLLSSLSDIETRLTQLNAAITAINMPDGIMPSQIEGWRADYLALQAQVNAPVTPKFDWRIIIAALLLGLVLIWLAAKFFFGIKAKTRPLKSALYRTETPGVVFPANPMLAGNVSAPLAPAGKLAAAQLQMLTGPYAVLRDAYLATGRIGYAQEGIPTAEDYSFGTGFLVSDRHVITNRHVHGMYGHYLLDDTDPGGIEFIAEKDKDASDFAPFKNEPPLLLTGLDIAIYTLARPVKNRKPIALAPKETDGLDGQEIVVIGYPDTHTPERPDILAVVEDNPVFAVKRLSQGQIFRHSTDTDTPFGVETSVDEDDNTRFTMAAICHNASTMGGSSGSPLLDIRDGTLLGVHFAGFKVFNRKEAANLAMAIQQLTSSQAIKNWQT